MNERPLQLQRMYILSAITLVFMFAVSGFAWFQLPGDVQIPVHFDASGTPDRYGGKFEGLFLMPIVVSLAVALLSFVPRIQPRKSNLADSQKAYKAVWAGVLALFAVVHTSVVAMALGVPIGIVPLVPLAVGALFIVLGNYMGKTRSNWVIGIRTPWTLESELAWDKTHRLGGKLFVILGLSFMLSPLFSNADLWAYVLIGGALSVSLFLTVYSYFVWKSDPEIHAQ